jgi:hypothetical protein
MNVIIPEVLERLVLPARFVSSNGINEFDRQVLGESIAPNCEKLFGIEIGSTQHDYTDPATL